MSDIAAARFKRKQKAEDCTAEEMLSAALENIRADEPLRAVLVVEYADGLEHFVSGAATFREIAGMLEGAKFQMFFADCDDSE